MALSTLLWLTQADPVGDFSISEVTGFTEPYDSTRWQKALEGSFHDFIPQLPIARDIEGWVTGFHFQDSR